MAERLSEWITGSKILGLRFRKEESDGRDFIFMCYAYR